MCSPSGSNCHELLICDLAGCDNKKTLNSGRGPGMTIFRLLVISRSRNQWNGLQGLPSHIAPVMPLPSVMV
jgi:hypothetical protein